MTSPAKVTALHNGVLVQNDAVLAGETLYIGKPSTRPYATAPIKLQAHGDPSPPISFRNIWVLNSPRGHSAFREQTKATERQRHAWKLGTVLYRQT